MGHTIAHVWGRAEESAESARSVIYAIFRLITRILTFRDKKYRILTFRDKTESFLTALQQNNAKAC